MAEASPVLQRFTSRNYITDQWLANNPGAMIECWYCGKLIPKDDPRRKYCNSICKKRYFRMIRRTPPPIKYCEWCGKAFEALRSDKVYCSDKCIKANFRAKKGIPIMGTFDIKCRECKTLFTPNTASRKYCSYGCFLLRKLRSKKFQHRRERGSKLPFDKKAWTKACQDEVKESINLLRKSGMEESMAFDENDWKRRAEESRTRILAKFAVQQ